MGCDRTPDEGGDGGTIVPWSGPEVRALKGVGGCGRVWEGAGRGGKGRKGARRGAKWVVTFAYGNVRSAA